MPFPDKGQTWRTKVDLQSMPLWQISSAEVNSVTLGGKKRQIWPYIQLPTFSEVAPPGWQRQSWMQALIYNPSTIQRHQNHFYTPMPWWHKLPLKIIIINKNKTSNFFAWQQAMTGPTKLSKPCSETLGECTPKIKPHNSHTFERIHQILTVNRTWNCSQMLKISFKNHTDEMKFGTKGSTFGGWLFHTKFHPHWCIMLTLWSK